MAMSEQWCGVQGTKVFDNGLDALLLEIEMELQMADFSCDGNGALPSVALTVGGPKISLGGEVVPRVGGTPGQFVMMGYCCLLRRGRCHGNGVRL